MSNHKSLKLNVSICLPCRFLPSFLPFFQGLSLARPEIVPFRLTPSMVDGMGLCGFEGVYRRVMETCMSVLRTNRETLLSVLEPFLQARQEENKNENKKRTRT